MTEQFNESLHVVAMYGAEGTIIGGGIFLRHGTTVTNLYANVLREYRRKYPGEFLYWSVIEHFSDGQTEFLDLGRSLVGSGNETFKLRWKAEKFPLCYWYTLGRAKEIPHMNQQNPRFQLAIKTWQTLPQRLTDTLGSYLIRGVA
jgi:Acetyltransferase (GNAT) domain